MENLLLLSKNVLLRSTSTGEYFRIVHLDYPGDEVYLFECKQDLNECTFPVKNSIEETVDRINKGDLALPVNDPFMKSVNSTRSSKFLEEIQAKAWNSIRPITQEVPALFSPTLRNSLVNAAVDMSKSSVPSIYKWLKMYWRNGMTPAALYPDFSRCGARGKDRNLKATSAACRQIIKTGYHNYFLKSGFTLRKAYLETKRNLYKEDKHGKVFTEGAFRFHGERSRGNTAIVRKRFGRRIYQNSKRLLSGRANDIAPGACKVFQIDSTMRDIQIVSSLDPTLCIGRPTFYLVVDTFSRMIVGIHITLEPPSYMSLCNAIYNTGRNKVEFAKEIGLDIKPQDWFTQSMPEEFIADRGEFLGPQSNPIVQNLDIIVSNTAAYNPSMKGIVENLIGKVQDRVNHLFKDKGQVTKDHGQRLARDTRKDATVNLKELYQITIRTVIDYNNKHWIDSYSRTKEMEFEKVDLIPAEIYKWAIKNGHGQERIVDKTTLWLNLMPQKELIPSRLGIRINRQHYVPIDEVDFQLLEDLIHVPNPDPVVVTYDPRKYDEVFWLHGKRFIPLRLRGKEDVQFSNEWEVIASNDFYKSRKDELKPGEEEAHEITDNENEKTINRRCRKSGARTKGGKEARKEERLININNEEKPTPTSENKSPRIERGKTLSKKPDYDDLLDEVNN